MAELASARHRERYRAAALLWLCVVAPPVLALIMLRPWLWSIGLAYVVLFGVNVGYAKVGAERSLANDLFLVAECAAMVPLMAAVAAGGGDWIPAGAILDREVGILSALCALTLTGSTLHVKSLIRERRNPVFTRASRLFAAACVPLAVVGAIAWGSGGGWLVLPFLWLALRTWWPVMRDWRPARVGLVELAGFVAVAVGAILAV